MTASITAGMHVRSAGEAGTTDVAVSPALTGRNRLTVAFRMILAFPHLLLVGGPAAAGLSLGWTGEGQSALHWSAGTGLLGAVAGVAALIAWFAILFTGRYPEGLWDLAIYYLRWRVRAVAYVSLLRDEYPPFGDGSHPAVVTVVAPTGPRNRLTVAFRIILVLPHILAVWALGLAWALSTFAAWLCILVTGKFPPHLFNFGVGVLRWSTRVEAYLLLLHDEYPPFSLEKSHMRGRR